MTTLTFAGSGQVRIRPRLGRTGHDDNAADTVKSAALHVGPMTGLAAAADPRMTHLPAGKRLETASHRCLVTTVTPEPSGIGQMVAGHALGTKVIVTGRTWECCKG